MPARTLVVGLDGATWDVVRPALARLPNLAALLARGAHAPLRSTRPPLTFPAWTSVLTGARPDEHGIVDFFCRVPGTYRVRLLDARDRRRPSVHACLSARGRRVAMVGVPGTWPPERLDGLHLAGFDSPVATRADASFGLPRAEVRALSDRFGALRFADFAETRVDLPWARRARDALLREIGRKEALCAELLGREAWSLFMVVFGESDTASHHFWRYHDPTSPRFAEGFREGLLSVYERLDAALGRLAPHARRVFVVSDHGFGPAGDRALYVNRYLEQGGWLRARPAWGQGVRRRALELPTERIVRGFPGLASRVESAVRRAGVELRATRAWCDELGYAVTVHLNVRGRDPHGVVEDVPTASRALERWLLAWRVEGERVVARVVPGVEVYGDVPGAPDLLVELTTPGGASWTILPSAGAPPGVTWRRLAPEELGGGKGAGTNGTHRPLGVFLAAGEGIRAGPIPTLGVEDVAPTLLALDGEPIPASMSGRVVEALAARDIPRAVAPPAWVLPAPSAALGARLAGLGYL